VIALPFLEAFVFFESHCEHLSNDVVAVAGQVLAEPVPVHRSRIRCRDGPSVLPIQIFRSDGRSLHFRRPDWFRWGHKLLPVRAEQSLAANRSFRFVLNDVQPGQRLADTLRQKWQRCGCLHSGEQYHQKQQWTLAEWYVSLFKSQQPPARSKRPIRFLRNRCF